MQIFSSCINNVFKHSKRLPASDTNAHLLTQTDMTSNTPSFEKHLKLMQIFSFMPLSLSRQSLSQVSNKYLFITGVFAILQLVHHWVPQISAQWNDRGPISIILSYVQKTVYSAQPFVFVIVTIRNRSQFERSTIQLLRVLRRLGLWEYRMYDSCKTFVVFLSVGISASVARIVVTMWLGEGGIFIITDDLLWMLQDTYLAAWALQFVYTVRSIEACYVKLSQTTTSNDLTPFFQIYNRLIDIAEETNDFYDFQISLVLLTFLLAFIDFTNITLERTVNILHTVYACTWMLILAVLLVCILGSCHSASDQARDCNEALFNHLIHDKIPVNHESPLLVVHLCARRSLVFKASKSFAINYNLGISMVAAYVTYMIVLFQIDHSPQLSNKSTTVPTPSEFNSTKLW